MSDIEGKKEKKEKQKEPEGIEVGADPEIGGTGAVSNFSGL